MLLSLLSSLTRRWFYGTEDLSIILLSASFWCLTCCHFIDTNKFRVFELSECLNCRPFLQILNKLHQQCESQLYPFISRDNRTRPQYTAHRCFFYYMYKVCTRNIKLCQLPILVALGLITLTWFGTSWDRILQWKVLVIFCSYMLHTD